MIRWGYVLPRLAIIGLIVACFTWLTDPLLRWMAVRSGEAVVGARVEIEDLETSLLSTSVVARGVKIAHPNAAMKNLLEFDEATLDFDTRALLKNRYIVESGRLAGVRFGSEREESGALDESDEEEQDSPSSGFLSSDDLAGYGEKWLATAAGELQADLENELESVRLSQEMFEQWQAEYDRLATRVDQVQERSKLLRDAAKTAKTDPLAALGQVEQTRQLLAEVQSEAAQLGPEMNRLWQQAQQDRVALDAARRRDIAKLRQRIKLENLDGDTLTRYLLGRQQQERISEIIRWVRIARRLIPKGAGETQRERPLGVDVEFPSPNSLPDFLVRSLELTGELQGGELPLAFQATLCDVTSDPVLHGKPITLEAQTSGDAEVHVAATFDRTQATSVDQIKIRCPAIEQPAMTLGKPEQLALAVEPGTAAVAVTLLLRGEELSGEVSYRQQVRGVQSHVANSYGGRRLQKSLQRTLDGIWELDATVTLSGTLEDPKWQVHSPLGPALARTMRDAFVDEVAAERQQLEQRLNERIGRELASFQQLVADRQQSLLSEHALLRQLLEASPADSMPLLSNPRDLLGRGLKLGEALSR